MNARHVVAVLLLVGGLPCLVASPSSAASGAQSAGAPPAAGAQPPAASPNETNGTSRTDFDPTQYIGLDLKTALETLGPPEEVFSYRGPQESQDDVVFYYPDFVYLFWYQNRVWQVRCDHRFSRPLFGLAMGMPREVIERTYLRPLMAKGDSLFFDLDDGKYPLRVRLVFSNDALSDLYVYRSDF